MDRAYGRERPSGAASQWRLAVPADTQREASSGRAPVGIVIGIRRTREGTRDAPRDPFARVDDHRAARSDVLDLPHVDRAGRTPRSVIVESTMRSAPLSVALPADLRARLAEEGRRRQLKLSSVVRVLAAERLREIDSEAELSDAHQWQRARAWATWRAVHEGDRREVARAEIDRDFARAIERVARRR
jgi:hypothetical protein